MVQTVSRSALVPYAAGDMYDLVADVEQYPGFLPWCRSAKVRARTPNTVEASLEIGRGPLHKTFTTRNVMTPGTRIDIELVNGPFRRLQGCWRFEALEDEGCRVRLEMEFEIAGSLLGKTLGPLFSEIANSMVDAFCRRAGELYGSN
jgi:ribosome-associated toxin RatA of RatAB toxin-antitoxin module